MRDGGAPEVSKPRGLFVPVYESLLRSVKLARLSKALTKDRFTLTGHLIALWTWCLSGLPRVDYALTPQEIARAAEWPARGADRFANALAEAGFLDPVDDGFVIHDWEEYGGKVVKAKQRDRDRHRDQGDSSTETPGNFRGISSLDETRRDETTRDETRREDTTRDLLIAPNGASMECAVAFAIGIFEQLNLNPPSRELIADYVARGLIDVDWQAAAEQVASRRLDEPIVDLDAWLRPKLDDLLGERTGDTRDQAGLRAAS